jgi:omega-6 fatty acid desaturase (delta-12 desaturase)
MGGEMPIYKLRAGDTLYRLPQVLRDVPELRQIGRVSLLESLWGVKLVPWDEASRRLISFHEACSLA